MPRRLLLVVMAVVFPCFVQAEKSCSDWGTVDFAKNALAPDITQCLAQGRDITETFGESHVTVLHEFAAYSKDPDTIVALIDAGADLSWKTPDGMTPFWYAIFRMQDVEMLQVLIEAGSPTQEVYSQGEYSPLHLAARQRHLDAVRLILETGIDPDPVDEHGGTPLGDAVATSERDYFIIQEEGRQAAIERAADIVQLLINAGADPLVRTSRGNTLLHFAARNDESMEIVPILIENGVEIDVTNNRGDTALHRAFFGGTDISVIETLIASGARVNEKNDEGHRPLDYVDRQPDWTSKVPPLMEAGLRFTDDQGLRFAMLASLICDVERVQAFATFGFDLTSRGPDGESLLHHIAANCDQEEPFRLFFDKGVPVDTLDSNSNTPLMAALDVDLYSRQSSMRPAMRILAAAGADPMRANHEGITPWQIAHDEDYLRPILLQAFDVNLNKTDANGRTLLHHAVTYAIENQKIDIVEHYVQAGVDLNIKDNDGNTPLHIVLNDFSRSDFYAEMALQNLLAGNPDPTIPDAQGRLPVFQWMESWDSNTRFEIVVNPDILNSQTGQGAAGLASLQEQLEARLYAFDVGMRAAQQGGQTVPEEVWFLQWLVAAPFDINTPDKEGNSVLYAAIVNGQPTSALGYILGKGADVNFSDKEGLTPLALAITRGFDDAAIALLTAGADPNITDAQGRTALHHLAERGETMNPAILSYLMEADANFNTRNNANQLPIEVAKKQTGNSQQLGAFKDADRASRSFWERWFQ